MNAASIYTECAYALGVAAAAMIYPPLALVVAAMFLVALAVLADRRSSPAGIEASAGHGEGGSTE